MAESWWLANKFSNALEQRKSIDVVTGMTKKIGSSLITSENISLLMENSFITSHKGLTFVK